MSLEEAVHELGGGLVNHGSDELEGPQQCNKSYQVSTDVSVCVMQPY